MSVSIFISFTPSVEGLAMDHELSSDTASPSSPDENEELVPSPPDDHELLTHIVLEGFPINNGQFVSAGPSVEEAMTSGIVISSLCGKSWVPSRSPSNYPICKTCVEEAGEFGWHIPPEG
jgi:hypothetical protein